jgi:hypothetical protein
MTLDSGGRNSGLVQALGMLDENFQVSLVLNCVTLSYVIILS